MDVTAVYVQVHQGSSISPEPAARTRVQMLTRHPKSPQITISAAHGVHAATWHVLTCRSGGPHLNLDRERSFFSLWGCFCRSLHVPAAKFLPTFKTLSRNWPFPLSLRSRRIRPVLRSRRASRIRGVANSVPSRFVPAFGSRNN
ncbi:hypothetical protein CRG98_017474 [Punica granatum]|uniref:Uncharacterized protein n=1 Tax=Punica granatum TaxID=22663 RepID=A0A2I0K0L3_PUNGR|nr:hypothetical protein CRG98_017474 [Punica granatum]